MPIRHGIFVNEPVEGARDIVDVATAVIGIVVTGDDADADLFPLDRPVLVADIRAALSAVGNDGTIGKALAAIADQASPVVVVQRVAEVADPGDQDDAVVGALADYSGVYGLLGAESLIGVRPRILGAPGLDTAPVAAAFGIVAKKLNAMSYLYCSGCEDVDDAILYREGFSQREQMLIWPDSTGWEGDIIARALGLRAQIDEVTGWHKTLSNVAIANMSGLAKPVFFDLQDSSTPAGLLNDAPVTTVVRMNGYRFWGNRTCSDEPLFAFESATRTAQVLRDSIAAGLAWAVDKPLTKGLVKDIIETIGADFREKIAQGRLIGASCWFDPALNSQGDLAAGKLVIDYDFTPVAPMEDLTLNQRITDKYYGSFSAV
ncbi:phage tail sheath subtilisin-like domain-containing protein [Sphingobium yanoikuyae]|uniref:phage tail sheath subtilisin-like domain-containing protein n=1 Tax=Sphingobium yanoikuyae TaxID=13690 RepID=UPI0008479A44|nr:phage tail sheath subtilisin-like domain-containing protein [Sphingobium yanoikuyae]